MLYISVHSKKSEWNENIERRGVLESSISIVRSLWCHSFQKFWKSYKAALKTAFALAPHAQQSTAECFGKAISIVRSFWKQFNKNSHPGLPQVAILPYKQSALQYPAVPCCFCHCIQLLCKNLRLHGCVYAVSVPSSLCPIYSIVKFYGNTRPAPKISGKVID